MKYLLDANTLIEAKNTYYRFSFCRGYWDWVSKKNESDTLFIIDKIKSELMNGNDELAAWIRVSPANLVIKPSIRLSTSLSLVAQWVSSQKYTEPARAVFFSSADYYLIAYAHSLGYTVVTREKSQPNGISRVKIPDVCIAIGVGVINPFQLLEQEGANFVCA